MSPRGQDQTFTERARREQIVAAAITVLARDGYVKATFARIAEEAAISPGLITYHFGSRDELLDAIGHTIDLRMDAAMAGRAEGAGGYVEALQLMIVGYVSYCTDEPESMLAMSQLRRGMATGGREDVLRESREKGIKEVEDMFTEGQQNGAYRRFDSRTMAITLISALGATPDELHRVGTDPETFGAELADLFAYAVAAHPSRVKPLAGRPSAKPSRPGRTGRLRFGRRADR